jgi:Leucine-rich repeat (LRR) protein
MILSDRESKLTLQRKLARITPALEDSAFSSTAVDLTLHEVLSFWSPQPAPPGDPVVLCPGRPGFDLERLMGEHGTTLTMPAEGLILSVTEVTDAGLKELAGLRGLSYLDLAFTPVTGAGLKELAALKALSSLGLGGTRVTNEGLKKLARLKGLSSLDLRRTRVTDAGLKELAGLKHLTSLDLSGTRVTEVGLKELAGLKRLSSLHLNDTRVTDDVLRALREVGLLHALSHARAEDGGRPSKPAEVASLSLRAGDGRGPKCLCENSM